MEFNLDHLLTFTEIVRDGSFSRAAERRHLSQPAVSHQMRELEQRAGVTLLERIGKKAVLTPAGRALFGHAERVLDELARATETLGAMRGEVAGLLRVGTGATACTYLLPPVLADFHKRYPRVELRLVTGNSQDIARAIFNNELDLGLVTLPVRTRGLSITPMFSDVLVGITGPETTARNKTITPDGLSRLPLVLYEPGGTTRAVIESWFGRAKHRRRVVLELGNIEAIKRTVQAGLGVSIVPLIAVRDELARRTLRAMSLRPVLQRQLAIVVRRDRRTNPLITALQDTMRHQAQGSACHR
jgi:DNA-binding transcriptional LysR family regulator